MESSGKLSVVVRFLGQLQGFSTAIRGFGEGGSAIFMSFLGNNVPNIELLKMTPQNLYIRWTG